MPKLSEEFVEQELKKASVTVINWGTSWWKLELQCTRCGRLWLPYATGEYGLPGGQKRRYWLCPRKCNRRATLDLEIVCFRPTHFTGEDLDNLLLIAMSLSDVPRQSNAAETSNTSSGEVKLDVAEVVYAERPINGKVHRIYCRAHPRTGQIEFWSERPFENMPLVEQEAFVEMVNSAQLLLTIRLGGHSPLAKLWEITSDE